MGLLESKMSSSNAPAGYHAAYEYYNIKDEV